MLRPLRALPARNLRSANRSAIPRLNAALATDSLSSDAASSPPSPAPASTSTRITRTIPPHPRPATEPSLASTKPPATEPYTITRTPSHQLPIYQLAKAGGNLKLTRIRKVSGDAAVLKQQLEDFLEPQPKEVGINSLTGHVIVKGWYKSQVENFLIAKGF